MLQEPEYKTVECPGIKFRKWTKSQSNMAINVGWDLKKWTHRHKTIKSSENSLNLIRTAQH